MCRLAPLIIDWFVLTIRLVGEVLNIIYVLHVSYVCTKERKYVSNACICICISGHPTFHMVHR